MDAGVIFLKLGYRAPDALEVALRDLDHPNDREALDIPEAEFHA